MKRIVMSAFAILLATAAVEAQTDTTKGNHRNHHEMQGRNPYQQLNLTADQQAQLKTMRDDFKKEADALKNQKLTEDERKTSMQALREKQHSQMEAILTPAQKAEFDKMQKDRKDGPRGEMRGKGDSSMHNNGAGLKRDEKGINLQKELALTTAQQEKVKEIRTDFKAKADKLHNDAALSADAKKQALRALAKAQQEEVKTVLTKEQQQKLESLRKERAGRNAR